MMRKYLLANGTVTNWKQGDMDRNGKLNAVDFALLKFCVHPPGNFAVVRPFKETAVRGALSCSFLAVSVVD